MGSYSGECWFFARALTPAGYGVVWNGEKLIYAHRLMFEVSRGEIPNGLELDHLCRNRSCINPDHLEAVTRKVNYERGLAPELFTRHHAYKTHCPKGHEYNNSNTYYRKDRPGHRECRSCRKETAAKHYKEKTNV